MATAQSNQFRVEVIPAPSGSSLENLASTMAAGTWAELTTTNINATLLRGCSVGNMLPFGNEFAWDPVHGEVHIVGSDHCSNEGGIQHVRYVASTNAWNTVQILPTNVGSHAYDHLLAHPTTGTLYLIQYGTGNIHRKLWNQSWQINAISAASISNITYSFACWTGTLAGAGTAGSLFVQEPAFGNVWIYDLQNTSWRIFPHVQYPAGPGQYAIHTNGAYSPVHNCAVFGGGDIFPNRMWRWNSNNTYTELSPTPFQFGTQKGSLCVDPVTGNFLTMANNQLWAINPLGSGTYTLQTGSRVPPAAVNTMDQTPNSLMVASILLPALGPNKGVMMCVSADSGASANVYLYKHA